MAFDPQHIDFSQINGGKEYDDSDIVSEEDINKLFKSASFVQKFVDVLSLFAVRSYIWSNHKLRLASSCSAVSPL